MSILAKGRALFPGVTPLISTGGGAAERRRVMEVSRMAALMERSGVPAVGERIDAEQPYFIPSACWRKIVPGILSTTRFAGMLVAGKERLAVYDIGDGRMEWQGRAEGSLFHPRYGSYEVQATGMLLICRDGLRNSVAEQIIHYTMWQRRQLLHDRLPAQWEPTQEELRQAHTIRCCGCGARCWRRFGIGRILKGHRGWMAKGSPPKRAAGRCGGGQ